jgi:1-acyl-sn-glycerol-3-phosphate acyltransferase
LLYNFLQIPARIALHFWCKSLKINNKVFLKHKGPLLIAANHPNSFLDAILLCSIFKNPIYSLARGDAFKNKTINKILRSLKMLPVYRVSEGVENLEENYKTFEDCINIFKQNGIVLIFSEGKCINEWNLRPLKKGTARLAMTAWEQGIPLQIIPAGINYNSFTSFGKNIILNFGDIITKENIAFKQEDSYGIKTQGFNTTLKTALEKLVIQSKPVNKNYIVTTFKNPVSAIKKILLFVPAILGFLLHAPLYIPIQKFAYKKFGTIDHYDSVMVAVLLLLYPFYLMVVALLFYFLFSSYWFLCVFVIMPACAWSYIQIKRHIFNDKK